MPGKTITPDPASFFAIFHAPLVLDLAGFCGIASRAGVPLVAALFAAACLRLRGLRRAETDENDDSQ
jgi:hypothetical protein